MKKPLIEFSKCDTSNRLMDKAAIERINPHRFELSLLDAILYEDVEKGSAVALHLARDDEFWVRGHFPSFALMPGVIICECAAQLCSFTAIRSGIYTKGLIALGGLEEVRFRGPVRPGDELVIMLVREKFREGVMIISRFESYVGQSLVAEGLIKGIAMLP